MKRTCILFVYLLTKVTGANIISHKVVKNRLWFQNLLLTSARIFAINMQQKM